MELPKIYKYLNSEYDPFVRYMFILPLNEFKSFLESVQDQTGISRELHGYEIDGCIIEFWDASDIMERTIKISFNELIELVDPLKILAIKNNPEDEEQIKNLICSIKDFTP